MQEIRASNGALRGSISASKRLLLSQKLPMENSPRLAPFTLSPNAAAAANQSDKGPRIFAAPVLYAISCDASLDEMSFGILEMAVDMSTGSMKGAPTLTEIDGDAVAEIVPGAGGEHLSTPTKNIGFPVPLSASDGCGWSGGAESCQ
jgi:hypothetical protein